MFLNFEAQTKHKNAFIFRVNTHPLSTLESVRKTDKCPRKINPLMLLEVLRSRTLNDLLALNVSDFYFENMSIFLFGMKFFDAH